METVDTKPLFRVGRWCAFVVGPSSGWDRTILGVVVYGGDGCQVFARWCGLSKAIARGDWRPDWFELAFNPPATWAEMEKRLASTGNAMSQARWEGGYATADWSATLNEGLYRSVMAE